VKVISTQAYGIGQEHFKDLDAEIPFKYAEVGRLLADWVIMKTGGKANVLLLGADNSPNTFPLKDAFNDEIAKHCTNDCKVKYVSVPTPNWATQLQPEVQAAAVADPSINYVVPMYDGMASPVVAALRQTRNTERMPIATFNGSPSVLDMVRDGTVAMDIGEPAQWVGRAVLDADMRVVAGLPAPKELQVPLRIFDSSNVAEAGTPATIDKGYGDAAEAGFAKVWRLP
jgi:ribose transport system substrate-binding protein